jgi:predicted DNA-binding protein with PD1-like motif
MIIARIDKGEEILSVITKIIEKENIKLGSVSAVGAINYLKAGLFEPKEKNYLVNVFEKDMEIVSFIGNITAMNGKPYIHVHIAAADSVGKTVGGHLSAAVVSLTAEMIINIYNGEVGRAFDGDIGLNLLKF